MASPHLDVNAIAALARLDLTHGEAEAFGAQLDRVLEHIARLEEVDISGVEPTAHASPVFNVVREDVPVAGLESSEALAIAPRKANGLFLVPKVIE